ncbi:Acyl-CoA thioesterase [Klenkia marina]|uniref:Acyl-CoA thioesterase n=1 Tax=Klenkia marina TaxID=1960309 RepID=A0A1G4XSR8_9ACTN|nr:thioesterase family protein [Klenkia marina]SCX44269.1 Acyl-CoA thioesterase [Klenkia marina]
MTGTVTGTPAGTWTFDGTWRTFTGLEGGLVLGAMAEAAHRVTTEHARPGSLVTVRTVQAHFLRPVDTGQEFTVLAHPWRTGGTTSLQLQAEQGGDARVVGQALVGAVPGPPGPRPGQPLPDGPDVGEALVLPVDFVPVSQHVEIRAVGPGRPLAGGTDPRLAAWLRVREPAAVPDPHVALGLLVDVLPPSLYAVSTAPAVMPTVELTLHLHGTPPAAGSWLRLEQWTDLVDDFGCVDEAVVHDEGGRLVARARQTRRVARPQ